MKKKIWTGLMGVVYIFGGFSTSIYLTTLNNQMLNAYGPDWVRTAIFVFWGFCAILLGLVLGVNYVAAALMTNSPDESGSTTADSNK